MNLEEQPDLPDTCPGCGNDEAEERITEIDTDADVVTSDSDGVATAPFCTDCGKRIGKTSDGGGA